MSKIVGGLTWLEKLKLKVLARNGGYKSNGKPKKKKKKWGKGGGAGGGRGLNSR